MKPIAALVVLLVAAPLYAQTRVYTNADLGKPLADMARPDPAVAAALLAPHQFVAMPRFTGPTIIVFGSPTAGPFGEFAPFDPPRRLDGTLLSNRPWRSTTFLPYPYTLGGGWAPIPPRVDRRPAGTPNRRR